MSIIYALDPGNTSGYCIVDVEWFQGEHGRDFRIIGILEFGEFVYPEGVLEQLHKARSAKTIVIEDFIVRKPLIGDKIYALRTIGAYESMWPDRCVFQQPAEKSRVPDSILRSHGCWNPSLHIRDAFRHFFIYMFKRRGNNLRGKLKR